jgi:hypothetical protein
LLTATEFVHERTPCAGFGGSPDHSQSTACLEGSRR